MSPGEDFPDLGTVTAQAICRPGDNHWKHAESSFLAIPVHVTDTDANIPSVQNPPTVKQRERKTWEEGFDKK